jgi:hypothetical protein
MTSATSAAAASADVAATASADVAAAAPTATMAAATAASTGELDGAADVFPVEQVEGGETDVGHFLLAKDEALVG